MTNFLDRIMVGIDGVDRSVKDFFTENDFIIKKKDAFIKHGPMLRVTKQLFGINKTVNVIQAPNMSNDNTAVVSCQFEFCPRNNKKTVESYVWSSLADCGPLNPPPHGNNYPSAIAETRADARAFRFILGLDFCSYEEIGNTNPANSTHEAGEFHLEIQPPQKRVIEKFLNERDWTLKDVSKVVKKEINSLEELTGAEASTVIEKFNRRKK